MALSAAESIRTNISASGTFHRAPTGLTNTVDGSLAVTRATSWTFGSSGADTVNQAVTTIFTATKNTTTSLDLSGALVNVTGETAATFTKVKWILFELLTAAQDSVNGNAFADSVVIAPGGTNPITTSPLGTSQTYTMQAGDKWLCEKHTSGGITVAGGSADTFDFTIAANNLDAIFRITVLGNS